MSALLCWRRGCYGWEGMALEMVEVEVLWCMTGGCEGGLSVDDGGDVGVVA